jgi:hypothetical protein
MRSAYPTSHAAPTMHNHTARSPARAAAVGIFNGPYRSITVRRAPSQPVSLPPRPVFLAGREELLGELDARLSAGDGRSPRIVALCGLAGAGKTSVAVEYAHRHLAGAGQVWQFPAADPTVMRADFARLADLLGAQDPVGPGYPGGVGARGTGRLPGGLAGGVRQRAGSGVGGAVLPPAGPGRVLITSQSALWPPGQALEVPVLDAKVAAGFLISRTGDPDQRAAAELADELGGLPLALEQAAAYVQAPPGSGPMRQVPTGWW